MACLGAFLNPALCPFPFCYFRFSSRNCILTSIINLTSRSSVLRESVQKEFRQSKYELDPAMILRMIFTGREALRRTEEALELKRLKLMGFKGETMEDAIEMSEKVSTPNSTFKRF